MLSRFGTYKTELLCKIVTRYMHLVTRLYGCSMARGCLMARGAHSGAVGTAVLVRRRSEGRYFFVEIAHYQSAVPTVAGFVIDTVP